MHVLERVAIESLAKQLFDDVNRAYPIYWKTSSEKDRNGWRKKAEALLNEAYYSEKS